MSEQEQKSRADQQRDWEREREIQIAAERAKDERTFQAMVDAPSEDNPRCGGDCPAPSKMALSTFELLANVTDEGSHRWGPPLRTVPRSRWIALHLLADLGDLETYLDTIEEEHNTMSLGGELSSDWPTIGAARAIRALRGSVKQLACVVKKLDDAIGHCELVELRHDDLVRLLTLYRAAGGTVWPTPASVMYSVVNAAAEHPAAFFEWGRTMKIWPAPAAAQSPPDRL